MKAFLILVIQLFVMTGILLLLTLGAHAQQGL